LRLAGGCRRIDLHALELTAAAATQGRQRKEQERPDCTKSSHNAPPNERLYAGGMNVCARQVARGYVNSTATVNGGRFRKSRRQRKSLLRGASLKRPVKNRSVGEISSRFRLVFLLFCLLLRCH
jgi:hypothetical protein